LPIEILHNGVQMGRGVFGGLKCKCVFGETFIEKSRSTRNPVKRPRVKGILPTGLTHTSSSVAQFSFQFPEVSGRWRVNHSISLAIRHYSLTTRKSRNWRHFNGRTRSQHWRRKLLAALVLIKYNCCFSSVFP